MNSSVRRSYYYFSLNADQDQDALCNCFDLERIAIALSSKNYLLLTFVKQNKES